MIKVAIIGAGAIANTHIEELLKFQEKCQITAIADIYPDKAQEKIERFDLDSAMVYEDYKKLLAETEIDLAIILTPPFAHAETTIAALSAGSNVLVEKPMATSLEECDAMISAAERNKKLLSVVAQNRYKTPMMKLKAVLDSEMAGEIKHAQVDSFWWRGQSYYDLWWRGTWEKEGGGCTMNHAVHHIDLFQWMMGMPAEVQAVITNINHDNSEVEDFSTAVLLYEDGRVGQINASLVHHGENQRLIFQGEKASISAPWRVQASIAMDNGFPEVNTALEEEISQFYDQLPGVEFEGHAGQIANVLATLEGKEELLIDGVAGRSTIELVMAIFQSGTIGERVKLPMTPADPFYTRAGILKNAPHFHEKTRSVESASEYITFGSEYKEEDE
jgi:UDP-N-acetyl-2-amino-2-deoxyglucuronate dehydrogenase